MYELEQNDSEHNLHGGSKGLHTEICDYEIINEDEAVTIIYNAELLSKNDHFPGDIQIKVFHRYDLSKMEWTINYEATSTERSEERRVGKEGRYEWAGGEGKEKV